MPRRGLPSGIEELTRLAHRYPHVRVVLDHAGLPDLQRRPDFGIDGPHRTLAQAPNVYCKVTTLNLDLLREAQVSASEFIQRLVTVYGSERIMWGSDLGNSAGDYRQMVSRILVATAPLHEAERGRILHSTGKGVFVRGGHR
jgi:predicted TIM-barrel fold metal-dependent hydrolase